MSDAPAPRTRRWRWLRRLLVIAVLILVLSLSRGRLLPAAAQFLDVSEPPQPVDAVMVLGGNADTRPFVAAALIRAGLAQRALVPMFRPPADNEDGLALAEHELIRRVLRARGVRDEEVVTIPGEVASTQDEARALCRFFEAEPEATVAVITNGYHTRRARMLFHHELGERMARVHFIAAPTIGWSAVNWWRSEAGFTSCVTEYFKLAYYGLREDRSCQATVLGLAALLVVVMLVRRFRRLAPPSRRKVEGEPVAPRR